MLTSMKLNPFVVYMFLDFNFVWSDQVEELFRKSSILLYHVGL